VIGGAETFGYLARKLEAERAEADAIVPAIQASPERFLDVPLPPAWRTLGMAEALCDAARTELVRAPRNSLYLAQLAIEIGRASCRERV